MDDTISQTIYFLTIWSNQGSTMWIIKSWESYWCKKRWHPVSLWMPSCSLLSGGRATDARDTDHKMEVNWPTWQFQTLQANHSYFPSTQWRWWGGTVGAFRVMILLRRLFGEWALTRESWAKAVGIVDFSQRNMFMQQLITLSKLLLAN